MSQIPIKEITFSKLSILKSKCIVYKKGKSVTWDDIVDKLIETANQNESQFLKLLNTIENG